MGSFKWDVQYDHTVRLTCDGKALEMKAEAAVRSFRCTWRAPRGGYATVSVHCSVRLFPDARWVKLVVDLQEGQAELKGKLQATFSMDAALMSTAEDLLAYTFDACARHNEFMDALRMGDDELALGYLQANSTLYVGKRKVAHTPCDTDRMAAAVILTIFFFFSFHSILRSFVVHEVCCEQ